jgi:catechol 2,3-dioxygenase-like lactoylglutathione lyase family enzyme
MPQLRIFVGVSLTRVGGAMSKRSEADDPGVGVECIIPILSVRDVAASARFYRDTLGFRVDWGEGEGSGMASVSRDGHAIMLCHGEQGQPGTWIWIGVENIEPLYAQYAARGATFREKPRNHPWAYEMRIEDPDGHVLRFGSEPRTDRPFD